ncbi:hypothetical protein LTR04_000249 [Oleoguttula sp. CCFEE 6159]|nr:hypothetical protein LTR04_000249 [Oleoguttula sp. CCFEE 6159]
MPTDVPLGLPPTRYYLARETLVRTTSRTAPLKRLGYDGSSDLLYPGVVRRGTVAARIQSLNAHTSRPPSPPPGSVAARVRAANTRNESDSISTRNVLRDSVANLAKTQTLASKDSARPNPFVRRDSDATPTRSESSTVRSRPSTISPTLYHPAPKRIVPSLEKAAEQTPYVLDTSRGDNDPEVISSGFGRRQTQAFSARRTSRAYERGQGRVHFTLSVDRIDSTNLCEHHRREAGLPKGGAKGTTQVVERNRKGGYELVGPKVRSQVEATSPWAIIAKHSAKRKGTTLSPEICPQCLLEQAAPDESIVAEESAIQKSRNATQGLGSTRPADDKRRSISSSLFTEPSTPQNGAIHPSLIGVTYDSQPIDLPGAAIEFPLDKVGTVVAADLGDMLDAIIVEHSGNLGTVITNLQNGVLKAEEVRRLSKELAQASRNFADAPLEDVASLSPQEWEERWRSQQPSIDDSLDLLREKTESMPSLLQLVDDAASDFGYDIGQPRRTGSRASSRDDGPDIAHRLVNDVPSVSTSPVHNAVRPTSHDSEPDTSYFRPYDVSESAQGDQCDCHDHIPTPPDYTYDASSISSRFTSLIPRHTLDRNLRPTEGSFESFHSALPSPMPPATEETNAHVLAERAAEKQDTKTRSATSNRLHASARFLESFDTVFEGLK